MYIEKYILGEIFSSGGATLYKNPSDQTVLRHKSPMFMNSVQSFLSKKKAQIPKTLMYQSTMEKTLVHKCLAVVTGLMMSNVSGMPLFGLVVNIVGEGCLEITFLPLY